MNGKSHRRQCAGDTAQRGVNRKSHCIHAVGVDSQNFRGAGVLGGRTNGASDFTFIDKQHRRYGNNGGDDKSDKTDMRHTQRVVKQRGGFPLGVRDLHIGGKRQIHQLLNHNAYAKSRQNGDKQIAFHNAPNYRPIQRPSENKQQHRRDRHSPYRVYAVLVQKERDITAQNDKFTLRDINNFHHAPDHRHAIRRQRKQRADDQTINRRLPHQPWRDD